MAVATQQEILIHLESIDCNELLDRMENYVRDRFYDKQAESKGGFKYLDFCVDVIGKACLGVRNWNKDAISFEGFIFGCLKSDLSNYFRKERKLKFKNQYDSKEQNEIYIIDCDEYIVLDECVLIDESPDRDIEVYKRNVLSSLKAQGADNLELQVFECWIEGYTKPKDIADLLDITTAEVNIVVKRLNRKRIKIQEQWQSLKK